MSFAPVQSDWMCLTAASIALECALDIDARSAAVVTAKSKAIVQRQISLHIPCIIVALSEFDFTLASSDR